MFFKVRFLNEIDENLLSNVHLDFNPHMSKEIIIFESHEFEVERNSDGRITELTFCTQCVNTFNIEEKLIQLVIKLLHSDESVIMVESDGTEDEMTKEDLEEYFK